jgi:NADPH:quinone reductase-like Zn-dependent oxidoreductase
MRAIVHRRYGPAEVLHLDTLPDPVPAAGEVVVRVHAAAVNRSDTGLRSAHPFIARYFTGIRRPKQPVLGSEFSGVVSAVGGPDTGFSVGDAVFGDHNPGMGAHAEYLCMPARGAIVHKPAALSFVEAAGACDGAILALGFLRRAQVSTGTRLLVYGADGSIGSAAVQLAKVAGAHVTAVCHGDNAEAVRVLGPDVVLDRTREDFTTRGDLYDAVFDAVGKLTFWHCRKALTPTGAFLHTDLGPGWQNPLLALVTKRLPGRTLHFPLPVYRKADVQYLADLAEAGTYRPLIDRTFPFEEFLAATRYVETGQKVGNVVLTLVAD